MADETSLPATLAAERSAIEQWQSEHSHWLAPDHGLSPDDAIRAMTLSPFVAETVQREPDAVSGWLFDRALDEPVTPDWLRDRLGEYMATVADEATLHRALRRFRREVMFRVIARDVLRWSALDETMAAVTTLADEAIDAALSWLHDQACEQWGTPWGVDPVTGEESPQHLVVLGMGKLGGCELNVSSDIDLIFAFPAKGETRGGARALDNQQFFARLGQRLIQALDQMTADGFVFRVDMRLRPYGQSGALALSFPAMESYYQDQGREWERYAMVKARVVAGDRRAGERLMESLRPFVYRKYIDFSAFESLRAMKGMISRQVRRKGLQSNIKLGSGGIREIEFVVQAFQLIRGGRDRALQQRHLLDVLPALVELELLPDDVTRELEAAYRFLRTLEHALQGLSDRQTQELPEDDVSQTRVALMMGCQDWESCLSALAFHRDRVAHHFANIIASEDDDSQQGDEMDEHWQSIWLGEMDEARACEWLSAQGYENARDSYERLSQLRQSRPVQTMQSEGQRRLYRFMPVLLDALSRVDAPSRTLERVLELVESVLRRTAYLLLLLENPGALRQLVWLCGESPWIARQLAETPLLLDELLNAESLYHPPTRDELQDDLRQQLLRVPLEDLEEQMEVLRHFKKAHVLRVAASELSGTLPLMKVSDYLTWIAEVALDHVVEVAFSNLVSRHGYPRRDDGSACDTDFAIVGYGKLGGIELGYTSDLDLVFLHNADPQLSTDGDRPIDNAVFYTRLGQRIVHILSTQTPSGQLYEVDLRLRPSGNSGLLVSQVQAFEKYQNEDAWTWEHQALARARGVAGCRDTLAAFEGIRRRVLCQQRDRDALRDAVVKMRERMRDNLGSAGDAQELASEFHIKQDRGGIIDVEFMAQYLMLAWCSDYPALTRYSDNIRQLEALGEVGVLTPDDAQRLREVFITLRSTIHRQALQNRSSRVAPDAFPDERAIIWSYWERIMLADRS
ncbi:bifunctional glutamine synthetase adenylyltransferase/deadenyltransferase [Tamilnaduibacter salinus]|uniref:Bifunctional glutamine synthetase adenylyltransferase/adenylyl-removing enzyme n=1 Tax=Tamilnaduibacter salinus TaxID=1484056 RepID=A0A2A2I430_9GAMM|nr:bifunctional [glutamate--ammonia ligase]-adenylyl-L-tyrosine phosphorylase/[glutamate--ammonia-ligase] adenylyltransferase [Tamilnaduibacter salinus]PAV25885.1 bifunctional glutamine synthetase adenylyltransferase/deadenyltransferase [Tamilnaduibacter salinus]